MLVAHNEENIRCIAWETERSEAPFHCPECQGEVILKKGKKKEHHYAHKPSVNCAYGSTESQLHLQAKREIYNALVGHPDCKKCEIERSTLVGVRPDISLRIRNVPVAIEVQCSKIDISEIIQRTTRYSELGIYLLWLIPHNEPSTFWREIDFTCVHRIKEWEKFIHSMYFSQLYFWQGGAVVTAFDFKPLEIHVEEKTRFGEYGDVQYSGGYTKTAKTLTTPVAESSYHIVDDFKPVTLQEFEMDYYSIQNCKLWVDRY